MQTGRARSESARNTRRSHSIAPIILPSLMGASEGSGRCWKACAPISAGTASRIAKTSSGSMTPAARAPSRSSREGSLSFRARRSTTPTRPRTSSLVISPLAARWRSRSGIGFLTLGMSPKWPLAETPSMPKSRYAIMARYMPKVGTRGLDMMFRTATVQANLDFASEQDMVAKMRVGLALQPAITALFANSPFTDGKLNGLSVRSLGDLAPYRSRAHRHARLRLRARHGV